MEQISDLSILPTVTSALSMRFAFGKAVGRDGFPGFFDNLVTVLPEGNYYEMFGWVKPFRLKSSASHLLLPVVAA